MRKLSYRVENKKGYIAGIKTLTRAKELAKQMGGRITSYLEEVSESAATGRYVGVAPKTPYSPPYKLNR